jgi:hypothetical protein
MQNIFSKIDKKILIILGIVLVVALIAVFFIYKYSNEVRTTVGNTEEQITDPEENLPEQEQEELPVIGNPQIEIQPQPGLTICADQCGDGVCKPADSACGNGLNCPCDEDKTSCPQDCQ